MVLACLVSASIRAEDPPSDPVPGWIRDLDADDPAVRDSAEDALARAGLRVRGAVEEALKSESAEVRSRATRILSEIDVRTALHPPSLKGLHDRWKEIHSRDPFVRRDAIRSWYAEAEVDAAGFEAILSVAGRESQEWVFPALCRLGAPRIVRQFDSTFRGMSGRGSQKVTPDELARRAAGQLLRISEGAKAKFAGVRIEDIAADGGTNPLDDLDRVADKTGTAILMCEPAQEVWFQTVEEACDWWKSWWKSASTDEALLMHLGLKPIADGARLDEAGLARWVKELESGDGWRVGVAQAVLGGVPDGGRAKLEQALAGGGVGARRYAGRLKYREAGRILVHAVTGEKQRAWVAGLDGGGWRCVSGDVVLDAAPQAHADGRGAWAVGTDPSGRRGLWKLDLSGDKAPELVIPDAGCFLASSDDEHAFVWKTRDGVHATSWGAPQFFAQIYASTAGAPELVHLRTGKREATDLVAAETLFWSPDGKSFVWKEAKGDAWFRRKLGAEKAEPLPFPAEVRRWSWSPGGKKLAFVANFDGGTERAVGIWEADSGEVRKVISGLPQYGTSQVGWSRDGAVLAVAQPTTEAGMVNGMVFTVLDVKSGKVMDWAKVEPGSLERPAGILLQDARLDAAVRGPGAGESVLLLAAERVGQPVPALNAALAVERGSIVLRFTGYRVETLSDRLDRASTVQFLPR